MENKLTIEITSSGYAVTVENELGKFVNKSIEHLEPGVEFAEAIEIDRSNVHPVICDHLDAINIREIMNALK